MSADIIVPPHIQPQIQDFEKKLMSLLHETLQACEKAGIIKHAENDLLQKNLEENGLTSVQITRDCMQHLYESCLCEYEEVIPGSNRFQGKGYSVQKIEEEMKTFLKQKLKHFLFCLSNYSNEKNNVPKKKNKSFLQVLHDIKK